jgi:hypothetical protein
VLEQVVHSTCLAPLNDGCYGGSTLYLAFLQPGG